MNEFVLNDRLNDDQRTALLVRPILKLSFGSKGANRTGKWRKHWCSGCWFNSSSICFTLIFLYLIYFTSNIHKLKQIK